MGIFGLASWDPPPALSPHLTPGLAPRVLSEQAAVSASPKETSDVCQNYTGVHQSNATCSIYSPGAHAAVTEKNPFWSGSAGTQALPVEEPSPPLGVEKMHEARVSRSEVKCGPQNHTIISKGVQPKNSSETECDADAVKLIRCGRGSQFKSSGGTPSVGAISRPCVVGSVFQTGQNAAKMVTQQNPGFLGGSQLGNGGSGFSGREWKAVEHAPCGSAVNGAVRATQAPAIAVTKGLRDQRVLQNVDDHLTSCLNPTSPEFVPKVDPVVANQVGCRLIAKHNYEANPDSPFGASGELNLRRMEQLVKIGCHPEHNIWWLARNENGEEGYIPASYVMVLEEKCGLPWLQNRAPEEEEAPSTTLSAKPYRSAYNRSSTTLTGSSQFACEPCGKSFNGPQPYRAHMSSRAHRETLETMD